MNEENKKDKRKEYRLDDFQLSKISELDYESLTNLIDKGKEIMNLIHVLNILANLYLLLF